MEYLCKPWLKKNKRKQHTQKGKTLQEKAKHIKFSTQI